MKPRRLLLENVHSFRGLHSLDLSQIACAVLSGGNGNGKSTLASDAPLYCLFGETRGDANSIISDGELVGRVEFEFSLGDEVFLVSRQRSRKGNGSTVLSFQRLTAAGPEVLDGKTILETQKRIEQTLHMTADLLRMTAFSIQGNAAAFSRAKPADRKRVLGDILDLGAWERRADAARQMGRDLQARRDDQESVRARLYTQGLTATALESELGLLGGHIDCLQGSLLNCESDLAAAQAERERLISEEAADRAARAGLMEADRQSSAAAKARAVIAERVSSITKIVAFRSETLFDLKAAEAAASEAAEMEAARQERERLAGEGRTLGEQIKAAKGEHAAAIKEIEQRIEAAQSKHSDGIASRRQAIAQLAKQAEVLDSVPCAAAGNTPLVDACPLIAQAREAREALPAHRRDLAWLEGRTPGLEDGERLAELRRQTPGADLIAQRDALRTQHDAIAYDPAGHAETNTRAAGFQKLQADLARIDAQAALLPQARADLQTAQAEADRLAQKVRELTATLDPERDWAAELAAADRQAAAAKAELARLRTEIEAAQQRRGQLTEQLAGAHAAAEEAKRLAGDIADADRRLNLLKILGNSRDGAYSKGGIPALLIERAVPELEEAANEVLETLSDGQMALELRTQRETSGKSLSETLDVVVLDERGPRLYETFSGGEGMRVDLALRIGLSTLMARRAGARCEMLVLDETAAPLDQRGQEQFVEALGKVSERFGTVLCISHLEALRDAFPTRIEVSKGPEGSRVEVISP